MNDPIQNPAAPKAEAGTETPAQNTPCAASPEPAAEPAADADVNKTAELDVPPEPPAEPAADAASAEAEPDAATVIVQLKEQVEATRDQMLRALAEAENTRRRAERDRQDIAKYALTDFARELLSPADNLRRALDAVPADAIGQDAVLTNLNDGVAATERELLAALEKIGVKKIDSMDQKFDPNFHQAMFEVPDSGKPAGIIVQVIQEGFTIHDRLLRPALVGIAKAEPAQKVDTTA